MSVVKADDLVISVEYDPAGHWCHMWDNKVLGWVIDETGAAEVKPAIVGALPPAVSLAPILSPQWALLRSGNLVVPDLWRGSIDQFFYWLSSNNGARRQLLGVFIDPEAITAWTRWSADNPDLVWEGPPP